jgi:TPP-dependent indolepyruvate ferredoxin oxidoreductase alpha subunit
MAVEGTMTNMMTGSLGGPVPEAPAPTAADVLATTPETEAAPVEAAPAPAPAPEKPRSDRFAALARKEAEVFRKQQAVRAQQAEIARQAEEIRAFQEAKRQAALNPIDALKQLGLTYEQITEYVLNDNKPTPSAEVQLVRQELEEFKRVQREEQQRLVEQQKAMIAQEQQQIISAFRDEVNDYVTQHSETYELTALYGGHNLVADVVEEHFKQSGKLLTIPEAAKLVEEHYEDLARKAQATKKFAATQQKVASPQGQTTATAPKIGPTLSNDLSAVATAAPKSPRSDADRIAAALARLEGR